MMFAMCGGLCAGEPCWKTMKMMVIYTGYVICLPITAILLTGANLILGDDNVVAKKLGDLGDFKINMDLVTFLKLFEILGSIWAKSNIPFDWSIATNSKLLLIDMLAPALHISGESLPQLILGITFIVNNGGAVTHPLNTCSAVLSAGSVLIGLITSVIMWKKLFNDEIND